MEEIKALQICRKEFSTIRPALQKKKNAKGSFLDGKEKTTTRNRKWQPTPVLLPGKFRGPRSLVGYSPWGHKESDTTEQLH